MAGLALVAGLLVVALTALLCVPLAVDVRVDSSAESARVALAWGPWRLDRLGLEPDRPVPAPRTRPRTRARWWLQASNRSRRQGARSARGLLRALATPGLRRTLWRLLSRLSNSVALRRGWLDVRFGLGDPGATGQLWGHLVPLTMAVASRGTGDIRLIPEFDGTLLAVQGAARVEVIPARAVLAVLAGLMAPAVWRALLRARRLRDHRTVREHCS